MKNKKRQRSLLWRVARLNACTLFLSNVLLVLCLLSLFFFSTLRAEKQDLERMVTQLSERVVLVGTPSKASFADVTLRDGLSFALYAMDQTVLYVSSYGMPSTTVREFPPEVKIIGHTDYTTFAREGQTRDMIVHAASFVQTDEETVVLYVVSDISYLLTLLSAGVYLFPAWWRVAWWVGLIGLLIAAGGGNVKYLALLAACLPPQRDVLENQC